MQYLGLFNMDPVQAKVQDCLARARAMRESYRERVKKLKEMCSSCGLFPKLGVAPLDEEFTPSLYGSNECLNVFMLHDKVADLKRMIADAVFCFNLE